MFFQGIFLLLFLYLQSFAQYITFDSGNELRYDYLYQSIWTCISGTFFTNSITFSGNGFANIPKVIVSNFYYNYYNQANCEFSFNITEITKTNFTTAVFCPSNRMYGFTFTWFATDDERVEVINVFNQSMVGIATKAYTFSHYNQNVNKGFITFISFGFSGPLDFSLQVNFVNYTSVEVQYTTSTTNLLQVGYQIVLGTSEAFTYSPLINFTAASYDTGFIPVSSTQFLILPYAGIKYTNTYNLRQRRNTTISNSSGIQYSYNCWGSGSYVQLTYSKVWLLYNITQMFSPLISQKMRTVKKFNPYSQNNPQMILTINELGLIKSGTFSQDYFFLNNTYQNLNLVVTYQCNLGQVIQGQVLKCYSCKNAYWIINQNCYSDHNQIIYYVNLYQKDSVYQIITLDVNNRGFIITQKVQNQINSTETVINMQIIN